MPRPKRFLYISKIAANEKRCGLGCKVCFLLLRDVRSEKRCRIGRLPGCRFSGEGGAIEIFLLRSNKKFTGRGKTATYQEGVFEAEKCFLRGAQKVWEKRRDYLKIERPRFLQTTRPQEKKRRGPAGCRISWTQCLGAGKNKRWFHFLKSPWWNKVLKIKGTINGDKAQPF